MKPIGTAWVVLAFVLLAPADAAESPLRDPIPEKILKGDIVVEAYCEWMLGRSERNRSCHRCRAPINAALNPKVAVRRWRGLPLAV